MKKYYGLSLLPLLTVWMMLAPPRAKRPAAQATPGSPANAQQGSAPVTGQSRTLLPNGDWLMLGGESAKGPLATASTMDAATGAVTPLSSTLAQPRAWHSATVLPNGLVLIFGGIGSDGQVVTTAELFDPSTKQFQIVSTLGLTPRAHHTATVLTDGSLLIVGGTLASGETVSLAESWNWQSAAGSALSRSLVTARRDHTATLLADGEVLFWGGFDRNGATINYGEAFDPRTSTFRIETTPLQVSNDSPLIEESIPADNSDNVPITTIVAVRLSKPLRVTTVNETTVTLSGPSGPVSVQVVPAEAGMLAFMTPQSPLVPGTSYSLTIAGATDPSENALPQATITFATAGAALGLSDGTATGTGTDANTPADSQAAKLPPLEAPQGVTALSGQSLKLNGSPLEELTIQDEGSGAKAETDDTGRFLLAPLSAGHHVLYVNGHTAKNDGQVYGTYEIGVDIVGGKTNVLSYKIWMTPLDTAHAVKIQSPTSSDLVITNPNLPGLELHIPKGTVITDHQGKVVHEISITLIPLSQPPFPLPQGVQVPIYFTIQPGAAYLSTNGGTGPQGAELYYPSGGHPAGAPFDFWNYNPDGMGWYIYGHGKVNVEGKQVIPDPGVRIYEFTGAMVGGSGNGPGSGAPPGAPGPMPPGVPPGSPAPPGSGGDPVDFSTGLFNYVKTDLVLSDVLPISLTRSYRPADSMSRAFGVGTTHPFDLFIVGDSANYSYVELIMPDGGRLRYDRISPGNSFANAVFVHSSTTTGFYGSVITWNGNGWNMLLKNGTTYIFPEAFQAPSPQACALIGIRDRYGNTVTFTRDSNHNLTQLTTQNGRWIQLTYDTSNRITQAQDNIGRTVSYTYDSGGRLSTVTDAKGGTTTYTYDSNGNMLTITDPRGLTFLTNQYDSNSRVVKQTMADGSTFQFSYTLSGNSSQTHFVTNSPGYTGAGPGLDILGFRTCQGCAEGYTPVVSQVDITDQRGYVHRVVFNGSGYVATDTYAVDRPEQQSTTYQYYADNLIKSITDSLARTTTYTYDANSNVTQITRLSGTPNALTSAFTYESVHNQVVTATDPLGRTTTFDYDNEGNLVAAVDPLSQETSFTYNSAGQPLSATDALNDKTTFAYDSGDLVSITDPLSRTAQRFTDGAGRLVTFTNPLGQTTRNQYDALNEITQVTDPAGNNTSFSYDGNGNLLSLTDANSHTTSYTYDTMDRLLTRSDPLTNTEYYQYDAAGNLTQFTDRRGKIATYQYDALNRRTLAGFGTSVGTPNTYDSSIAYSYDAGNRLLNVVDSAAGTLTPEFDILDRLVSEQTPQGTVSYVYDPIGRRTQMTVAGQSSVNYTYDNANRLTQITQGSSTVSFSYDSGNRRTALTLPNGITMSYSYDNASQLTGISYTNGSTNLGSLTYGYDLAGRRTSMGGSLAQTALPLPVNEAEYNADNQLTEWGTASLYYDPNGNMTSDGVNTLVWNARNQMSSMNTSAVSFQYDPYGRRSGKTVAGITTNYLYDGANITQEISAGSPIANLLSGGVDEVFTRTDSSGTANFLTDALGSTLALTDGSGSTLASYAYEPFGNTTVTSGSSINEFEYTGRENDGTGLYFYRTRYYSSNLQRFMSEDPGGLAAGINFYRFTLDDPLDHTDPTGLWGGVDDAVAAGGGAAVGLISQGFGDLMSFHLSSWESYTGSAVGGAVGGETLLYTLNPFLAGAVGGAASNLTKQGLSHVSGDQTGFDTGGFVVDTATGFATGFIPEAKGAVSMPPNDLSPVEKGIIEKVWQNWMQPAANGAWSFVKNFVPTSSSTAGRK